MAPLAALRAPDLRSQPLELAVRAADPGALDPAALYRAHVHAVSQWVKRLAGPTADVDDLVHDTFLVAFRRMHTWTPERAAFTTWLYGIAIRVVQGRRRREGIRRRLFDLFGRHDAEAGTPDPHEAIEREQGRRLLYELLDDIGETYRTTLVLFEIEGLPGEQIAELLGISIDNVWVRVHRGRQRLRAAMARRNAEDEGGRRRGR